MKTKSTRDMLLESGNVKLSFSSFKNVVDKDKASKDKASKDKAIAARKAELKPNYRKS